MENAYKVIFRNAKLDPLTRGMGWGFIGGLTGTMVMDGLLMVAFLAIKVTGSVVLLDRGRHCLTTLFKIGFAGGRWHSNRRHSTLFDRSAVWCALWCNNGQVSCAETDHFEKDLTRGDPVRRDL